MNNRKWLPPLALTCAVLWSLAYPLIKLGYRELGIASDDLGSKILFAGIRFWTAGVLVLLLPGARHQDKRAISKSGWGWLLLFALMNTTLQYLCSYIGLGYTPSARGAILNSTGSFLLILLSCLIFSDDQMSWNKALGCLLGFSGIVLINVEPGQAMFSNVTLLGDGMILLNAVSSAFGGILSRVVSRKMNMTFATGAGMAIGGGVLFLAGLWVGPDRPWNLSAAGIGIVIALILISSIGFSIYNSLLAHHPISTVAIYNAFIPVFGVVFSSLILGERFLWKYLLAGLLVAAGIITVNGRKRR
ncbi:DMT family transporter [Dysosmobacter sp.]|uniref:DMT family transporter n=1 Tax=Dysosmobacter sp. TaxID=2591382 RepID=UPI002A8FC3CB|nr:DMT family transporter [Dysosmobacter sp.]MDY3281866.1 DMT family transporter [Dysosmobacter sp.]